MLSKHMGHGGASVYTSTGIGESYHGLSLTLMELHEMRRSLSSLSTSWSLGGHCPSLAARLCLLC